MRTHLNIIYSVIASLVIALPLHLSAQQDLRYSNWHFGCNAGISFQEGSIKIIPSNIQSREGTASISDRNGKLLFYTDGRTIFNAKGKITASGLFGHSSSTTSVIAIPVIEDKSDEYWVFTNDSGANNRGLNYYRYSVVKEKLLEGPVRMLSHQTEKLTALRPCELENHWVVAQDRLGIFHTWSVGESIVKSSTQDSKTGRLTQRETSSHLKFSENGNWLVNVLPDYPNRRFGGKIKIYQYSYRTGMILNLDAPIVLDFNHDEKGNFIGFPYGVEFSPFGRFLYISVVANAQYGEGGELYQYDLYAKNVNASRALIAKATRARINFGSLQIGPDGRIYMAMEGANESSSSCPCYQPYPYLGVIESPDNRGKLCGFKQDGLSLSHGKFTDECRFSSPAGGKIGLPAMVAGSLMPCYAR